MNHFKYPFLAFFQPLELEARLGTNLALRKRVAWTHAALAGSWFVAWGVASYLLVFGQSENLLQSVMLTLIVTLGIYALTLVIGFAAGGLSKRDSLVTFIVSTYWSFFISLLTLLMLKVAKTRPPGEWFITVVIVSAAIIITMIVVNLLSKTRGFRPAVVVALVVGIGIVLLSLNRDTDVTLVPTQEVESGQQLIYAHAYYPTFGFLGLFPLPQFSSSYAFLQRDEKNGQYITRIRGEGNYEGNSFEASSVGVFRVTQRSLDQLKGRIPAPYIEKLKTITDKPFLGQDFAQKLDELFKNDSFYDYEIIDEARTDSRTFAGKHYITDSPRRGRLPLAFKDELRSRENLIGIRLPNNDILSQPSPVSGLNEIQRRSNQGVIWKAQLRSNPILLNAYDYFSGYSDVVFDGNYLYFFAEDRSYVLDVYTGRDLTEKTDFSWYPSRLGKVLPGQLTDEGVIAVSPSGYFFSLVPSGETVNIYRQPVYVEQVQRYSRNLVLVFAYYLILVTTILLIGLYRIPIFVVESIWQCAMLPGVRRNPASHAMRLPLFFDHISTLRLPGSSWFLSRVGQTDEAERGRLLIYLLERTQQTKLAARQAKKVLFQNPSITIAWFYQLLKPEKKKIFDLLNKEFQAQAKAHKPAPDSANVRVRLLHKNREYDNRIENLFKTYERFMLADPKEPMIDEIIEALKPFADDGYKHAREVFLTYEVFKKFYGLANVQEMADVDLALRELRQISVAETLNLNLADTWGVVVELSNDLINYDVVESFRDKQYYLSEARIKLYEITRRAQQDVAKPEGAVLAEIIEKWQELIIAEAKQLRGPAELQLAIANRQISANGDWSNVQITIRNVGQSPAENIAVSLLENESLTVFENKKQVRLLGTGETSNLEFTIKPEGNITELRMYFDASFDDFERKQKAFTFADVISLVTSVSEFKRIPNPYVVGIPLQSDKVFYGRRNVLNFALENLRADEQNNVLVFYGQRRIGKSSLLYRIKDSQLKDSCLFVYIDCQGFADADTGRVLYRICESIYFAAQDQGRALEKPNLEKFKENTFLELDEFLDRYQTTFAKHTLVLMLDEYEYLEYKVKNGSLSPEIFNKLRNLMQHRNKNLTFIFVGTHKLTELTSNYWSFLFNTALYYEIGPLGAAEARALITEPVKGYLRYDDLTVEKILRVTGMHPYFIQGTCRALVNYCNRRQKNYATLTDVNEVLQEAVETSTAHVKYLYQDYANETEQQILTFLARTTDDSKASSTAKEISRFAFENGFQFEPGPVQEILSTLKNKRLLRDDGEMHEQFSFEYEFLRIWIKEHIRIRNGALFTS